jgi:catalase
MPLLDKAGVAPDIDGGFVELKGSGDATTFVQACRKVRFWEREAKVKQV